jgi:hypothetical protein
MLFILVGRVWAFLHVSRTALASHWLEDCATLMPMPEETTNAAPTTLSAIQAASQFTFFNAQIKLHLWKAGMT